jgi:hypothetical protein
MMLILKMCYDDVAQMVERTLCMHAAQVSMLCLVVLACVLRVP